MVVAKLVRSFGSSEISQKVLLARMFGQSIEPHRSAADASQLNTPLPDSARTRVLHPDLITGSAHRVDRDVGRRHQQTYED